MRLECTESESLGNLETPLYAETTVESNRELLAVLRDVRRDLLRHDAVRTAVRELRRHASTWDLWVSVGLTVCGAAGQVWATAHFWPAVVPLVLVAVAGLSGLTSLAHESWHRRAHPDPKLDRWLSHWLIGALVFSNNEALTKDHAIHHRVPGEDADPNRITWAISEQEFQQRMLDRLLLFPLLIKVLRKAITGADHEQNYRDGSHQLTRQNVVAALLLHGAWAGGLLLASPAAFLFGYLLPIPLVSLAANLRERREHERLSDGRTAVFDHHCPNWERWLIPGGFFNLHALHHAFPEIPQRALPELYRVIERTVDVETEYYGRSPQLRRRHSYFEGLQGEGTMAHEIECQRGYEHDIPKQTVAECPVCGGKERTQLFRVHEHEYTTTTDDEFHLMECDDCGAWFLDPRPHADALDVIYPPNYYAHVLEKRSQGDVTKHKRGFFYRLGLAAFKKRVAPIAQHLELSPKTSWLDIGCGNGNALQAMQEAYGCRGTGLDLSEAAVDFCRRRGFDAYPSRFEEFEAPNGERFDLVHSSHVIEHVESPYDYMKKAWDLLEPGGLNVFITPNTATWEARKFGPYWGGLHVPRHWAMLDERSAKALGERTGFEHVATHYSTNGTFWTWSCHARLQRVLPAGLNDWLFPSDHRFIEGRAWNVLRTIGFTLFDAANVLFRGQSANMLVIFRKPRD